MIDSSPPTLTTNPIAFFTFSGNEPNLSFECSLDGVAFSGCGEFTEFTDLLPGVHELRVRAVDGVGNVDPTPAVFVWRIGPAVDTAILSGPDEVHSSSTAVIVLTSNLPDVTYECALDEAADSGFFLPCTNPVVYTDLAPGEHEFLARAVDAPATWTRRRPSGAGKWRRFRSRC